MTSKLFYIILCILSLLTQISESRITQEILGTVFKTSKDSPTTDQGTNWAVLVAGSNGFGNYRHQADICHAYQILKRGGIKDENIVVFMYDDIANNVENPRKGIIINNPKGGDVYKGVPKDYTGDSLTTSNLLAAILGDKKAIKGGSGKVVNSGPNDRIFIYYSDHGSPGVLTMPGDDDLYAKDFINTLKKKYESKTYKSMVIYVEACEAGSIFQGLLPNNMNIYVTTASNPDESSWAIYCPGYNPSPPAEYDTCLGDLYSVAWMEDSDAHNLGSESLEQQYKVVLERTAEHGDEHGSHVMQYGTMTLDQDYLSSYLGMNSNYPHKNHTHHKGGGHRQSISAFPVEQHEADILYLRQKVIRAEGPLKKAEAQKKLDEALSQRKQVDYNFENIGKTLFGAENGFEIIKTVRPSGQPIVDDWDCFKSMVTTYKSNCGALTTYGKKHMRAFANVCNAGVQQEEMAKVTSQIFVHCTLVQWIRNTINLFLLNTVSYVDDVAVLWAISKPSLLLLTEPLYMVSRLNSTIATKKEEERLCAPSNDLPDMSDVVSFATPPFGGKYLDWRAIRDKEKGERRQLFCLFCDTRSHEPSNCYIKTHRFPGEVIVPAL
ncbi:hypothetical protein KSS87_018472 [Heliosperma pusillum]|nr:hypothetical protein KSS87_018472 [Heliosperma pusillum]